ncbi:MAG: hypothetical protein MZW92_29610 [Comamonadaceae bacterium]|nr:hypothetical protein [Comamonadaceae bacterium]
MKPVQLRDPDLAARYAEWLELSSLHLKAAGFLPGKEWGIPYATGTSDQ